MKEEPMEVKVMRLMAWERAKGELRSLLRTYWSGENFEAMQSVVNEFIEAVESNGLQE